MEQHEKYDITQPIVLPAGMYHLNDNPSLNFQLNRLVNMDMGDLDKVRTVGARIKDIKSWISVLTQAAEEEEAAGNIKSAMGFYRMAEFYMDWKDPESLRCWCKARELFFAYFEDFFAGEHPIVEKIEVPYETYTLPLFKMNPDGASKGDIVVHGGFDSNYEEFFPQCMYLRQNGYTVYLFEGPGQGATIRLHSATLPIEWEKPVKAVLDYMKLTNVTWWVSPTAASMRREPRLSMTELPAASVLPSFPHSERTSTTPPSQPVLSGDCSMLYYFYLAG